MSGNRIQAYWAVRGVPPLLNRHMCSSAPACERRGPRCHWCPITRADAPRDVDGMLECCRPHAGSVSRGDSRRSQPSAAPAAHLLQHFPVAPPDTRPFLCLSSSRPPPSRGLLRPVAHREPQHCSRHGDHNDNPCQQRADRSLHASCLLVTVPLRALGSCSGHPVLVGRPRDRWAWLQKERSGHSQIGLTVS